MTENKQYILIPFEEGNLIFKDDGREFFNSVDCLKDNEIVDLLNEQEAEIKRLEDELQNLQTFKKVLEFAEKDMEERADWQAYCEKEFEGL